MASKNCKISVRLTPWQEQVLHEMSTTFNVSYSLLIRTIVGSWLTDHENEIYRFIDNKLIEKSKEHANNTETGKETKA